MAEPDHAFTFNVNPEPPDPPRYELVDLAELVAQVRDLGRRVLALEAAREADEDYAREMRDRA
jgi:hypothetical protein